MSSEIKKHLTSIPVLMIFAIIILLVSNPSKNKHRHAIEDTYIKANPVTGNFGAGWYVAKQIKYQNFYLFSIGKLKDETTTVGVLGNAFCLKDLDIFENPEIIPFYSEDEANIRLN